MERKFKFKFKKAQHQKSEPKPKKPKNKVPEEQANNLLHGITLATILETLVERYGWEELGAIVNINCFISNPSIKSSLKFLRKTPWAREKVERLYLKTL